MSSLKMDQVWFPDSEFNVTLPCKDAEAQSSKDINCDKYWLNNTLERQILQGTKLRQEKSQHYSVVHEYDNIVNINYLRPSCTGTRRNRKRPNKYNGIGTTPYPPRSYSPCKAINASARNFKPLTKNKPRSTTLHINKSRKKCHMRSAELAVPTKRQCIDTWRNKHKVLPGYMLDRLKQHVLNQRPVIYIPDAFNCFKKIKRIPQGFGRQAAAKDIIKKSHTTEIRKLCTIFGIRIAQILNKPVDVTLNLQLEKISKIVTKDILSEILNDQKKIYKYDVTNQKILSVISDKITIWIATILEQSSYKLLEEELRELEEEEGPVLDFLNNLIDIVAKSSEPISSNFDDNYDSKSEASYTEDIDTGENVLDEQYEKIDLPPDDTFNLGTPISDQKETSNYDIEKTMTTHKNSVAVDISQTILSHGSSDNLLKTEEVTKGDENISNVIKKEVNNIIDNIALELAPVTLYTESNDKELNEDFNISEPDVNKNQLFDLENQSKNNTDYVIQLNKTPIEENIHEGNKEYKKKQSKDFRWTEASFVQNTLNDLELQTKNDSDELAKFYEFQPKNNAEINDTVHLDNVETRDNTKEHYKNNHVIDLNTTTPNIIQDSLIDIELQTKNDKDEHNNQTNGTNTKNSNQITNVKIENNNLENYKEEYVEDSDVDTPNIFQNTIPDIEIRSKSEKLNEYQTKYNVATDNSNELNNDEILNDQKEHSRVERAEDLELLYDIAQDQLSDIEVQTKSSNNEDINFYEIQATGNIEVQNNNDFEDVGNQFQDLEGLYKQIEDPETGGQNDVSNVSGVFEIFSEELTDETNKKVKFSNTDIVTQGDLLNPKMNSETRLVENSNPNDADKVLWEPAIDNITFAEVHNNLLMNFDESWPADIRSPVLKPSESVSRSITSLGKILETDEKVSSPEPEDNISLIDNTEHIEPSVKTLEEHETAVFGNKISSNLDTFGVDENTSEPYLTQELEIISQLHIDDINESIKQTDNDIMAELHEYNVEEYIPKLNELDIIQTINVEKVCTKSEDKRNTKANTIIKTKRRPKKPMLQHKTKTAFKSNMLPLPKTKLKTVVTGQDHNRVGKRTEQKYKQEIVEVDNFRSPTSDQILDYKVYPETAPAWVSRAQGVSDEDTLERILKNNRKQTIMEYDMRKLCKDLNQGFINLEMWNEWIQNICNNVELWQQKSAAKTDRRDLEYLVKLKGKIYEDATLWMKLNKCMQQRMICYSSKGKNKSKITYRKHCKMCVGKNNAKKNTELL